MNQDLSEELAVLKGQLSVMVQSMGRIEQSLEKVVTMDRTLAQQTVQLENTNNKIRELEHEIKGWQQQQRTSVDLLDRKHGELAKEYNTTISSVRGAITAMKAFSGLATILVVATTGWAYNKIEANTTMNREQQFQIAQMARDLAALQDAPKRREGK